MTPDFVPHDTDAADPQAREARRKRLIFTGWRGGAGGGNRLGHEAASQSASGPGGRSAEAGRPIPVRAVAASTAVSM